MKEKLLEILAREIVRKLPNEKRDVYQFIEQQEDDLAQRSTTKEQFMQLLTLHSPHKQAAEHFNLSLEETFELMHEIEDNINKQLDEKIQQYQWIDFTEKLPEESGSPQFYLLLV